MQDDKRLPNQPDSCTVLYVPADDEFICAAREWARNHALDTTPIGAVIVLDGKIIARGANGSDYHKSNECLRTRLGCKRGKDYHLCPGCSIESHAEHKAIKSVVGAVDLARATLCLWGHWNPCPGCWTLIEESGICVVCLREDSQQLFDKGKVGHRIGDFSV